MGFQIDVKRGVFKSMVVEMSFENSGGGGFVNQGGGGFSNRWWWWMFRSVVVVGFQIRLVVKVDFQSSDGGGFLFEPKAPFFFSCFRFACSVLVSFVWIFLCRGCGVLLWW